MIDFRLALMCGIDIPIVECGLIIHQPRISEIALIGEESFFVGAQCVCFNKRMLNQDEFLLEDTNNFQIFMTIMQQDQNKKSDALLLLNLLFPTYKISFTPRSIMFTGEDKTIVMVDEKNFEFLQDIIQQILCLTSSSNTNSFNPADDKAAEIAKKLMRGRQRVAAEKGETNSSLFSRYLSILTIGSHTMSLQDLMNLTVFQLYDLMVRYNLYMNWDIDVRTRLAGGKPDDKPDDWMKNIH